ncbi:hypothetical protein Fcan01_20823 [Folsomia candida]|uniref:Uncharacterized protein n=1 Tax=Folsomia candida TaxID=158441 RepID=A0A226DIX9_FOLCA|nr:hypothetical protein Fcan01_20823 [Folsomia candida]
MVLTLKEEQNSCLLVNHHSSTVTSEGDGVTPKTSRRSSTSRGVKKSSDYKNQYEKICIRPLEIVVSNERFIFKRVSKVSTPNRPQPAGPSSPIKSSLTSIRPQPGPSSPSRPQAGPSTTKKSSLTPLRSGKNNQKQSMVASQSPDADLFISTLNVRDDDLVLHPGYFPFVCRFCDSTNCKSCEVFDQTKFF